MTVLDVAHLALNDVEVSEVFVTLIVKTAGSRHTAKLEVSVRGTEKIFGEHGGNSGGTDLLNHSLDGNPGSEEFDGEF